jgi:hypothetical protein
MKKGKDTTKQQLKQKECDQYMFSYVKNYRLQLDIIFS